MGRNFKGLWLWDLGSWYLFKIFFVEFWCYEDRMGNDLGYFFGVIRIVCFYLVDILEFLDKILFKGLYITLSLLVNWSCVRFLRGLGELEIRF